VVPTPAPLILPPQVAPSTQVVVPPQVVSPPTQVILPPQTVPTPQQSAPVVDPGVQVEEYLPGVDEQVELRRGVRPYGGGHPSDWSWGCGGSPYRTYGTCDDWKVGCDWQVSVDGMVMTREETNLAALGAVIDEDSAGNPLIDPRLESFDYSVGGRVAFMSQVPQYVGYQMYAAYEGIEEWNSSIVFPVFSPIPDPGADPDSTEQRSLHYRSSLHSGEINFVRYCHPMLRPYCGVRYIKFDDEINDFINQESPPPLAGPAPAPVITTDRLNLFDLENNLIGFQLGAGYQLVSWGERFFVEGFFNGGVYYNKIKYSNLTGVFNTIRFADDSATAGDDSAEFVTGSLNNDVSEISEISYVSESSISGVCRLNKCWALRAGYQMLWINNLHLADDAFLGADMDGRSLFFHGWHAGIECRR
jgi:hypothetical protein